MIINASAVREARIQKGWTQQQLAEVAGLSLRTIQRVEGQGPGSIETCNALCAVLELDRRALIDIPKRRDALPRGKLVALVFCGVLAGFFFGVAAMLLLR